MIFERTPIHSLRTPKNPNIFLIYPKVYLLQDADASFCRSAPNPKPEIQNPLACLTAAVSKIIIFGFFWKDRGASKDQGP